MSVSIRFIFLISLTFMDNVRISGTSEPISLSIYYESLCPFCIKFVTTQLWPTYKSIANIMDIELVPFGLASSKRFASKFEFKCQHGPLECKGNMIEACVINLYPDTKDNLNFVNCVARAGRKINPSEVAHRCANEIGMDWKSISSCINGLDGAYYLNEMGAKTKALRPSLYAVPWIVVNGVWNVDIQNEARSNLLELVCQLYQVICTKN